MVYVGIDDTDSSRGMCTTYVSAVLLDELKSQSSGWQLSALMQALVIVQEVYDALVSSVGMKTALETMALKIDKIYKE